MKKQEESGTSIDENDPITEALGTEGYTLTYKRNGVLQYFLDQESKHRITFSEVVSPTLGPFVLIPDDKFREFDHFRESVKVDTKEHILVDDVLKYYINQNTTFSVKDFKVSENVALLPKIVVDGYKDWQYTLI